MGHDRPLDLCGLCADSLPEWKCSESSGKSDFPVFRPHIIAHERKLIFGLMLSQTVNENLSEKDQGQHLLNAYSADWERVRAIAAELAKSI